MQKRFNIDQVAFSYTNLDDALEQLEKKVAKKEKAYICVSNVRATYIGNHDKGYCKILNASFLTLPDGKPVEWYAHISGYKDVKKCSGQDFFYKVCRISEKKGYTHFFYGSTPQIVEKLQVNLIKKFPSLKIIGAISPPNEAAGELANSDIVEHINHLKPNFVWVGLGAPKQEYFMDLIINKIAASILIGVGLVFDYEAETVNRAPKWMQKNGLEWAFVWYQQPRKITRSYLYFLYFIKLLIKRMYEKYREN